MKIKILPSKVGGTVVAPPSKSLSHRYLIGCALASGKSEILNVSDSEDIKATLNCIKALGGDFRRDGDKMTIIPIKNHTVENAVFDCNESGSTLRFFIPITLAFGAKNCKFTGSERLIERGVKEYENLFKNSCISIKTEKNAIEISGKLSKGEYEIFGDVSSQYASGMLFALSKIDGESRLKILGDVESRSYIDMTISVLKRLGADIVETQENEFLIRGKVSLDGGKFKVEGDWSNASFLIAVNEIFGGVQVLGLDENSAQGDKVAVKLFEKLNGENAEIDIKDCPDLAPVLFAYSAYKNGGTFINTRRLKVKESDRASAMKEELEKFGAVVEVAENSVVVKKTTLKPPVVSLCGHNDHRIVMALSVLMIKYGAEIFGAEAVNKSFPTFFDVLKSIGVNLYEI